MKKSRVVSLALVATLLMAASPVQDQAIAENPALARIATKNLAQAVTLLESFDLARRQTKPPQSRMGGPLDPLDQGMLDENPLFQQLFIHDPAAALGLLERVKAAGGGKK